METSPLTQAPQMRQQTEWELERQRNLEIVLTDIIASLKERGEPTTYTFHGEQALIREGSSVDRFVAQAEALSRASKEALEKVQGGDGREAYVRERAAAKIANLFELHENYARGLAEIVEQYPGLKDKVMEILPLITDQKTTEKNYLVQ